jgi:hypothetical protein
MMRLTEPRDMKRLIELHDEQNARDDTSYPLPIMFAPDGKLMPDIALALTVEKDGEVAQGVYFQTTQVVEMCFAGCDPGATAFSRREIKPVSYVLEALGFKGVLCLVPHPREEVLLKPLVATGFNARFAAFYLEI